MSTHTRLQRDRPSVIPQPPGTWSPVRNKIKYKWQFLCMDTAHIIKFYIHILGKVFSYQEQTTIYTFYEDWVKTNPYGVCVMTILWRVHLLYHYSLSDGWGSITIFFHWKKTILKENLIIRCMSDTYGWITGPGYIESCGSCFANFSSLYGGGIRARSFTVSLRWWTCTVHLMDWRFSLKLCSECVSSTWWQVINYNEKTYCKDLADRGDNEEKVASIWIGSIWQYLMINK